MIIKVMTILILYYTLVKGGGGGGGEGGAGPRGSSESQDYMDYDDEDGPLYCTKIHKVITAALMPGPYEYYKLVQPTNYIIPNQRQVFQLLWCIDPESLEYVVKVCDWLEAPEVHITIHETHLVVIRKDNGVKKYHGYAVINITQRCAHTMNNAYYQSPPVARYNSRVIDYDLKPDDETFVRHRNKWHKEQSLKRTDT